MTSESAVREHAHVLDRLLESTPRDTAAASPDVLDSIVHQSGGSVVLFGAGNLGRRAASLLTAAGVMVRCFSDNDASKWDREVDGIRILSPRAAAEYASNAPFLVTAWNHRHRYAETRRQLRALGVTSVLPITNLFWKFAVEFLPNYYQDLPQKALEQASSIRDALQLWEDDQSAREYIGQVAARVSGDMAAFEPPSGDQYFPIEASASCFERFMDGGAFDGDTLRELFARHGEHVAKVWAVEPDPQTLQILHAYVRSLPDTVGNRVDIVETALGSAEGTVAFSALGSSSSTINPNGSLHVRLSRIDDLVSSQLPTFIKLDIEGAELDALQGARRTIERSSPALAVCVYHAQDHLWRVPLLIREFSPNYSFFLRAHAADGWETVCYAIPRPR